MPTELPAGLAARANHALDSLHAFVYFIPEADEEWTRVGLRPGRMGELTRWDIAAVCIRLMACRMDRVLR